MRPDKSEHTCGLRDISVGGAYVKSSEHTEEGERIVAYFDHIGGLEGTVARTADDGFAMHFKISEHKREKLAAQLMWLLNRNDYSGEAARAHERIGAAGKRTTLRIDEGIILDVTLIDISISGASVSTSARPTIGSPVLLGEFPSIIRRHHEHGIGVEFITQQTPEAIRAFL